MSRVREQENNTQSPHAFATTLEAMLHAELIEDHLQSEMQASVDMRFLGATEH
jgi:hypothetical protein